ncbi:MAG: ribosome biogenesis GTPase Der [Patescibacteria group bacterium]|nr:ribosome biogenesis GTPase Der [Patescibacteria group bacterium]
METQNHKNEKKAKYLFKGADLAENQTPKIALIGQVNTGKSTLFNRLVSESKAIISSVPGTTRDRQYGICSWRSYNFTIIDTGGVEENKPKNELEKAIKKQIKEALKEANFIFFLIEARLPEDDFGPAFSGFEREISRLIKKTKKPCFLILNKADNLQKMKWALSLTWQKLGLGKAYPISATTGSGVGDLLDELLKMPWEFKKSDSQFLEKTIKVAIIGRPNVGKSTLLNALLGKEKAIVSNQPHTTRGPQDTLVYYKKKPFLLIDTAGIRQKRKISDFLEKIGVQKSLKMIQKSDVVLMVIDVTQTIGHQDKALLDLIIKSRKALIIILNKCDLEKAYQPRINLANWAPCLLISAKNKRNVEEIFPLIEQVKKNHFSIFSEDELSNFLKQTIIKFNWNEKIWQRIELKQAGTQPPKFILKIPRVFARRKLVPQAQINILKKELRKNWALEGTPIDIKTLKQ